jgi:transposase
LAGQEDRLQALVTAQPDATLAELREQLPTPAAVSTLWAELDRLGLTLKKNRPRDRTTSR